MWKFIFIILFYATSIYSQNSLVGKSEITINENGSLKKKIVLNPLPYNNGEKNIPYENFHSPLNQLNNTNIRWSYTEPTAIGDYCQTSGNGKYNVTGWDLNSERVSLYGNLNSTPIWEYPTDPNVFVNFVTISDTGGVVGVGSHHNVYLFNNISNVPFFNYDLIQLPDTGIATSLDVTNDGRFLVCSVSRQDSSTIFGFNSSSNVPVWKKKIIPTIPIGGAAIQGIRISGNDSLAIVNTYGEFFVIRTFTGQVIYQGLINPLSTSSGTQAVQGISGNGNFIATINYYGYIRVYQWNGTTYNLLWQNQEPPGTYYNWYTGVDITYDGSYIAAGTLNFLSSSTFDGKIKVFKTTSSGTPQWVYEGCGDEVTAVSFSRSGNILSVSSWGAFGNSSEDLYIFKTFLGNIPIFKVNTPGSFYYCSTSRDGRTVVASGKAVHARQFGNGGLLYNIDVDTTDVPTAITNNTSGFIKDHKLYQNYPNPFNPKSNIKYQISNNNYVTLKVYNVLGNEIRTLVNQQQNAGSYNVEFDGSNLSSGIYFYQLHAGDYIDTKKFILIK